MSYGYDRWSTGYPYSRRRRRRPGCLLLLARVIVFCVVVGVVGSIAQQWFSGRAQGAGDSGGGLIPGHSDFPDDPGGTGGSDSTGGSGGVREPGIGGSGGSARSGTPPDASAASALLTKNRFYRVGGLPDTECRAPSLTTTATAAQRAYDEHLFRCLVTAWTSSLRKAGLTTESPRVFVFDSPGTSPCGTFRPRSGRILAFYCPAGRTLYVDVQQMARSFPPEHHIAYALVLAHEYGHHLQNLAGILDAEDSVAYSHPNQELELSRRTELQASCFAGMFVRSVETSYPVTGLQRRAFEFYATHAFGDPQNASADERTHGTAQTQGRWIARGFTDDDTGECDTYVASAGAVE